MDFGLIWSEGKPSGLETTANVYKHNWIKVEGVLGLLVDGQHQNEHIR